MILWSVPDLETLIYKYHFLTYGLMALSSFRTSDPRLYINTFVLAYSNNSIGDILT